MAELPGVPDPGTDRVEVWNVRETVLNTGVRAAQDLRRWERALALNAENLTSLRARGASAHDQAIDAFNDYFPLLRLGRLAAARAVLLRCRDAFAAADDVLRLGMTLSALASAEDNAGHPDRAVDLERDALRFSYAAADPDGIGVGHHNLANYLQRGGADPGRVGAHRVAAGVVGYQTGSGALGGRLAALGRLLSTTDGARVPRSFGRVCALVGEVEGVDLAGLVARLPRRAPDGHTAVAAVLAAAAAAAAAEQAGRVDRALERWEPVVSALHAAVAEPAFDATAVLANVLEVNAEGWPALVPRPPPDAGRRARPRRPPPRPRRDRHRDRDRSDGDIGAVRTAVTSPSDRSVDGDPSDGDTSALRAAVESRSQRSGGGVVVRTCGSGPPDPPGRSMRTETG